MTMLLLIGAGVAGQRSAQVPALALGKPAQNAALQYGNDFESVSDASGDGGLCGLVREAKEAGRVIATALDQRRDAITSADLEASLTGGEDTATAQRKSYDAALQSLSAALPGLFVAAGDAVRFGPDYSALASAAHAPAARKLLQETGVLLSGGSVLTFRPPPAAAVCRDLKPVTLAVTGLAKTWKAAPECLRDAVAEALDARLGEIASSSCFCAAREAARADGDRLADALAKLPDLGGSRNGAYLKRTLEDPATRYSCDGSAPAATAAVPAVSPVETAVDTPAVVAPEPTPDAQWVPLHFP